MPTNDVPKDLSSHIQETWANVAPPPAAQVLHSTRDVSQPWWLLGFLLLRDVHQGQVGHALGLLQGSRRSYLKVDRFGVTLPAATSRCTTTRSGSRLPRGSHFLTEIFVFYQEERNLRKANYLLEGWIIIGKKKIFSLFLLVSFQFIIHLWLFYKLSFRWGAVKWCYIPCM